MANTESSGGRVFDKPFRSKRFGFIDLSEMEEDLPDEPTDKIELHTFKPGELKKTPQQYGIDGPVLVEKRFEMVCDDENFKTKKGMTEHSKYSTAILFKGQGDEDKFGTLKIAGRIGGGARAFGKKEFASFTAAEDNLKGNVIKKITRRRSGCTYPSSPVKKYVFSAEDPNFLPHFLKSVPYVFAAGLGVLGYCMYLKLRKSRMLEQ